MSSDNELSRESNADSIRSGSSSGKGFESSPYSDSLESPDTQPVNPYAAPAESVMSPPPPIIAGSYATPLASRGSRFFANLIDNVLASLVVMPVFAVLLIAFEGLFPEEGMSAIGEEVLLSVISFPLLLIATLLLNGYLLATRGQTIGKYFLKIQVVDFDTGQILSLGSIMVKRYLPIWIIQLLPFVGRIGALIDAVMIFGQEQRCGHDYIANTKVVVFQPSNRPR